MKINLSKKDKTLLKEQGIIIDSNQEISDDDALKILDSTYAIEAAFANSDRKSDLCFAEIYAKIADRISSQIRW